MAQSKWTRRGMMAGGSALAVGVASFAFRGKAGPRMTFSKADGHTLSRGNGAEPDTLDPHKASGNWENNIIGDMFIGLMTDAADGSAIFGAAESFTASDDGLVYTFKIREHNWSDGVPVTAHDFVFSFQRMANPRTAAQYVSLLYPIRNMEAAAAGRVPPEQIGARAIDARTLELTFNFQVPYIRELLTHYATFAVPRHVVEKYGDAWEHPQNIAVNGPFILKEWIPGGHVRLDKNPQFFGHDAVNLKSVNFYPTPDSSSAVKQFRSGEFDLVTDSVPPQQINWLKTYLPHELRLSPYILSQYVQFNVQRRPFNDPRVRLALSLAIDREIICTKVQRAGEQPAYALVPPGMPSYRSAELTFRHEPMVHRIARAKALLAQAGIGPRNPLTFDLNASNTTETKLVSIALQGMWNDIGVNVKITPFESATHYNMLRKRDFDVTWAGWIADYRDPKNYLTLFQTTTTDLNYGGYSNAAFDALVDRSDRERDVAARMDLLRRAEQTVIDDAAVVPVNFGVTRNVISSQVRGWVDNNVNVHRSRYFSLDRNDRTV